MILNFKKLVTENYLLLKILFFLSYTQKLLKSRDLKENEIFLLVNRKLLCKK